MIRKHLFASAVILLLAGCGSSSSDNAPGTGSAGTGTGSASTSSETETGSANTGTGTETSSVSTSTGTGTGTGGASTGTTTSRCEGLAATCGPSGDEDCCKSLLVTGGTFYRSYDGVDRTNKSYPATVSDFYLDKYEITVGRFRQFVEAGKGTQLNPPAAGDGKHPLIAGSGWDSTWNTSLARNTAALAAGMKCGESISQTWTDTAGANESKPINCLNWYTAFAFCAWDGGRLATEAEWNYAASGGNEQRYYPWSTTSTVIDSSYAVYGGNSTQNVGSKSPKGDGRWGQSDLAGNVSEWNLDWYGTFPNPCDNCAALTGASYRVVRGGSFGDTSYLRSSSRLGLRPQEPLNGYGARCARSGL